MEINKLSDIRGVVAIMAIPEGRFVAVAANIAGSYNFGSRDDLPGVRLPETAAEAALARYPVTWRVPDQSLPMYIPSPEVAFSLRRGGFDQTANLPLTNTTVHLTWPGQKHGVTIPSGSLCLAFGQGVFTFPSGQYIYDSSLEVPGTSVTVANITDDGLAEAGKPMAGASEVVGYTERYDSDTGDLEIRTLNP
jgi:hypothetical protein